MNAQVQKETATAIVEIALAFSQMSEYDRGQLAGYCQGLKAQLPRVSNKNTKEDN